MAQLITKTIRLDLDTPLSVYLKIAHGDPYSFLFESVEGGAVMGRYSAIGYDPDVVWRPEGEDPIADLKQRIDACRIENAPSDLPPMAAGGYFGMFGYDMIRHFEDIPDTNPDTLGLSDALLIRPRMIAVVDNIKQTLTLSAPLYPDSEETEESARQRIETAIEKLNEGITPPEYNTGQGDITFQPNMDKESFIKMVEKAKTHIVDGDIFQVVLSQRFEGPFKRDSLALYRSLRHLNPSPFLVLMNLGAFSLIASSPEIMVRLRDHVMTVRPIAGTRPRGNTAEEDEALATDLLADEKELAEHLMLLDLGRNDVGRMAKIGHVRVTDQYIVERYSHVMHIVSNVEGDVSHHKHPVDVLFSAFPAGTVSGAPKIRAMEIIDDLEPQRRGFYAGCIGYIDGLGNVDNCIALRTALLKGDRLVVQAGAGIVADSDPEAEYEETLNKAGALFAAAKDAAKDNLA